MRLKRKLGVMSGARCFKGQSGRTKGGQKKNNTEPLEYENDSITWYQHPNENKQENTWNGQKRKLLASLFLLVLVFFFATDHFPMDCKYVSRCYPLHIAEDNRTDKTKRNLKLLN